MSSIIFEILPEKVNPKCSSILITQPTVFCFFSNVASPDPVRDLSTERSDSNSITVSWEKPENTGRNDYYYQIIATDTNLEVVHAKDNFINTADTVEYTVPGLKPVTIYIISVVTHNGVSDQDSTSEGHRTVQVRGSTGEGGKTSST